MSAHILFNRAQHAAIIGDTATLHEIIARLCQRDDVEYVIGRIFAQAVIHGQLQVCEFVREFLGTTHRTLREQIIRDAAQLAQHDGHHEVAQYIAKWI